MKVRVAHVSLQFSDSNKQHTEDIEKIFARLKARRVAWVTGTESGPGAGNTGKELLRVAKESGYHIWVPSEEGKAVAEGSQRTDCWVAVRSDLVKKGSWKTGYIPAIPGSAQLYKAAKKAADLKPRWGPKGLVTVQFNATHAGLGVVNVGAGHYLTGARNPKAKSVHGINHWSLNQKLTDVIGAWARKEGAGSALVFYGGDQNMADNKNDQPQGDTFMGEPLTTMWDELRTWENTGHGNIDVIASYDEDRRVKALSIDALNDKEFSLHTDHFYVEGVFVVAPVRRR